MPSTPLMACSSGVVTADSTVCALAPVYTLVTVTCGGASCGYCAIGSRGMHTAPAITMNSEHTVAKTGRLMKKSTNTPRAPVSRRDQRPTYFTTATGTPSARFWVPETITWSPGTQNLADGVRSEE